MTKVLELLLQHQSFQWIFQDWFPLGFTGLISLLSKGLSRVFSITTVWKHQFFSTQPSFWSNSHICWRKKWQPTPVLLPGKSHGWKSLVGYSLWGCKELETTERLHFCFLTSIHEYWWYNIMIKRTGSGVRLTSMWPWISYLNFFHLIIVKGRHSVVCYSLWLHGLYSPWNSPGQNTGVGSLSLLQGIFPTQGSNCIAGRFFTSWATK